MLHSMGLQRVKHDLAADHQQHVIYQLSLLDYAQRKRKQDIKEIFQVYGSITA